MIQEKECQLLRKEYENSGMSQDSFAFHKGVDVWKMKYALRKGLAKKVTSDKIEFKEVALQAPLGSRNELIIKTSNGVEISISL